jgi:hypothetical protein
MILSEKTQTPFDTATIVSHRGTSRPSKLAIANRTGSVQGNTRINAAAGVTDTAIPVSKRPLDEDESGALF